MSLYNRTVFADKAYIDASLSEDLAKMNIFLLTPYKKLKGEAGVHDAFSSCPAKAVVICSQFCSAGDRDFFQLARRTLWLAARLQGALFSGILCIYTRPPLRRYFLLCYS